MKTIKELKKETIWEKGKVTTIGSQDLDEKTFLALNEGLKAAKNGKNVLYLSLPYNKKEIETRLAYFLMAESIEYSEFENIYKGITNFKDAICLVKNLPLEINDKLYWSVPEIIEIVNERKNLDLLVIDPLGIINISSLNGFTRKERFLDVMKKIRKLANDLNLGIILTAQIKRGEVEDNDLKEGKEIAELSDKYFAINEEDK